MVCHHTEAMLRNLTLSDPRTCSWRSITAAPWLKLPINNIQDTQSSFGALHAQGRADKTR